MGIKELLQQRKALKRKKPEFIRQDAHKKKRISWTWRKPKGSGSKMRIGHRGYKRPLEIGWGSPAQVRGLDWNGLVPVIVGNVDQVNALDPKKQSAVIASSVGTKKRIAIIAAATAKKIIITNYKDAAKFADDAKAKLDSARNEKKQLKQTREQKKEAVKKEAEKKKAKEQPKEELSGEEKKMEDKKEKDKALISTQ